MARPRKELYLEHFRVSSTVAPRLESSVQADSVNRRRGFLLRITPMCSPIAASPPKVYYVAALRPQLSFIILGFPIIS